MSIEHLEPMAVRNCVLLAIEVERVGARFYRRVADIFSERGQSEIAITFAYLADGEQQHEQRFARLLDRASGSVPGEEPEDPHEAETVDVDTGEIALLMRGEHEAPTVAISNMVFLGDEYMRAIALSLFRDAVYNKLGKVIDLIDVVSRGIAMEKSSLLYYSALRDEVGDHPIIEAIIEEEQRHLVQLTGMLEENLFQDL